VQIHAKTLTLVELWSLKAKRANGRPFHALNDIFDAAMDIINAAAFYFDESLDITKRKLQHLASVGGGLKLQEHPNGAVEFPPVDLDSNILALQAVSHYLGEQMLAALPKYSHMYRMATDRTLRGHMARKDKLIIDQIQKSIERLNSGNDIQFAAVDHVVQREVNVAKKENRAPDFFSKRTIDEVRLLVNFHLLAPFFFFFFLNMRI
jgi:hypothetical protein